MVLDDNITLCCGDSTTQVLYLTYVEYVDHPSVVVPKAWVPIVCNWHNWLNTSPGSQSVFQVNIYKIGLFRWGVIGIGTGCILCGP